MEPIEAPSDRPRRGIHVPGWLLAVIGVVVVFGIGLVIALAVNGGGDSHGRDVGDRFRQGFRDAGDGGGGGHHVRGLLILLVLLIAIGVGVYFLVRHFSRRQRQPRALDVLEDRFARGEIDEAEFRSRRAALSR
ncbi:MAG: SHOCT domain-containing protein [Acidimicrobiia bacterium]